MTIGTRLKELRVLKNVTQLDVIHALDIKRTTYATWEQDKNEPSASALVKIAQYFGVSTDYILGTEKTPNQDNILYKQIQDLSEADKITIQKILSALADKSKEQAQ